MIKKHNSLYYLSSLEVTRSICEFGFSSTITLYLMNILHYCNPLIAIINSNYFAIAYLLPIFCGYVADKYISAKKSIIMGCILIILSQIFFSYSASLYTPSDIIFFHVIFNSQFYLFVIGLIFLALGIGFTITNMSKIIKIMFIDNKNQLEEGFSILYLATNIGSFIGPILFSLIVGNNLYLYMWGYLVFAIFLIIGLGIYLFSQGVIKNIFNKFRYFIINIKKNNYRIIFNFFKNNLLTRNIKNKQFYGLKNKFNKHNLLLKGLLSKVEKDRMTVLMIIFLCVIIYRIAYHQISISLVFFLENCVDKTIFNMNIPTQLFFAINPIYVMIFTPLYVKIINKYENKGYQLNFIFKIVIGLILIIIAFFVLYLASYQMYLTNMKVNCLWMFLYEFFLGISELFIFLTVILMVGKLFPDAHFSVIFGLYTATIAIGKFLAGRMAILYPSIYSSTSIFGLITINTVYEYFLIFIILNLFVVIFLILFRRKLENKMHGITS